MSFLDLFRKKPEPKQLRSVRLMNGNEFSEQLSSGFTTLGERPEIMAGCFKIAQLISSMTIYLMANTDKGDVRIINELSRKIDIEPNKNMTRSTWMTAVVMNLLLYGNGNSIVYPHTSRGLLDSLEPIEADRVGFVDIKGREDYRVRIDSVDYDPRDVLHFVYNPDPRYLWHGQGLQVSLKQLAENLAQAAATEQAFMNSKWKPSIIIKVDGLTDEFSSPEGRSKLLDSYVHSNKAGEPWLIPSEQFSVEQVRPLSLSDLAINDSVVIDKKTVASLLGVPAFVLGVGEYRAEEWDSFINNTIRPIAQSIEQELTRKLITSAKMFLKFNVSTLFSYDLQKLSTVYSSLFDKGIITGNEVREKLGMQPHDGLDRLIVLENYIPQEDIGKQKKLGGNEE